MSDPTRTYESPSRTSGRHPVNVGHLVMGVAFLGLLTIWSLVQTDAVSTEDLRWLLPLPWVFAGGLGLLALLARSRRDRQPEPYAGPEVEPYVDPYDPYDPYTTYPDTGDTADGDTGRRAD